MHRSKLAEMVRMDLVFLDRMPRPIIDHVTKTRRRFEMDLFVRMREREIVLRSDWDERQFCPDKRSYSCVWSLDHHWFVNERNASSVRCWDFYNSISVPNIALPRAKEELLSKEWLNRRLWDDVQTYFNSRFSYGRFLIGKTRAYMSEDIIINNCRCQVYYIGIQLDRKNAMIFDSSWEKSPYLLK